MANKTKRSSQAPRRRKGRIGWLLLLAVVGAAAGVTAWSQLAPKAERDDPNVVVNLTTMVGEQAPTFTLSNSEGQAYDITPGDGRKYLLIFHMGSV
jgi:cytochrome oxidase Cu insertion factor (SCO1/SenC/PrrC family)